jgi:hypothetical protein
LPVPNCAPRLDIRFLDETNWSCDQEFMIPLNCRVNSEYRCRVNIEDRAQAPR